MSGEPDIGGYEEERALLKRYLSDEIAPMIFANNAAEILEAPPRLMAVEIQSWIGDQIRGASNMTVADLLAHAATKLHQLGILELVPRDDVARSLTALRPLLLQLCPAEQRPGFEQMFSHIEQSTGIGSSKTEVLHRQMPGGGQAAPGGAAAYPGAASAAPGLGAAVFGAATVDPASLRRIDLLLERLQRIAPPGGRAPESGDTGTVVAHVVEEVATHATSSRELEARLAALQGLGIAGLGAGLFERLSQGLPDWAPPPPESMAGAEPPAVAARAMRKVVRLAKDPSELLARFKELVGVAIEEFNRGALGRSVTMFDLAGRMVEQGDVDSNGAAAQIADSLGALDRGRLEALAEDPDKRLLLHRVMRFFPELRAERLLASLIEEEDRERRLQTLKLLRAHGQEARVEAVHALDESVNGATRQPWHVERNLLYLMRAIPPVGDETLDHEIDLLNMTSDLAGPLPVVRESLGALVQLKHPRAFGILAARVSQLEDALTATTSIPLDAKETRLLLSTIIKQLCLCGTNDALEIVIGHGLKGTPQLGDTYARMAQLATQDLSEYPAQLARILDAINLELPRRFLGVSIGAQRKALILDQLVTAISGTRSPDVLRLLADIVKRFPDQSYATIAREALAKSGRPAAESPAAAEDSITLSGDLALFGLPNLLQNLADNHLTGVLSLADASGRPTGALELANGQLVSAKAGRLEGEVAVYQLLERPLAGRFRFLSSEGETPDPVRARSVMSLLMEGMRRYDEFNRARTLVADDARLKPSGKKASDVKEDADPKLAKEVWGRAARGLPPAEVEAEMAIDCFRVRRLYEHWVTEGSLVPATSE